MLKFLKFVSRFLSTHTSIFVIFCAIFAFIFPPAFSWVHGNTSTVILALVMLTMGLTLTVEDVKVLFKRPLDILIGTCAQYTIMPLIALSLTKIFGLNPYLAIGIILVGCCPGGVSSNIMSFLCKGDVAYSVGMTTASTILAPMITPLLVLWFADTSIHVNAFGMFLNILVVTILPVTIGFFCNYFWGKKETFKNMALHQHVWVASPPFFC